MTAAALIMKMAVTSTDQGIIQAETHLFRQIHPVEPGQAERQGAELRIPERAAERQIPEGPRIPERAAERLEAAPRIPAEELRIPVQEQRPGDSNHWTFLFGTCMIIPSGQMVGFYAVWIKYL